MATLRNLAICLGLSAAVMLPDVAAATSEGSRAPRAKGVVVTRSAGTFNWLAAPEARIIPASARVPRQIGGGSWICSPAGSGRGSSCYAN